jgi:hypothetical protein
MKFLTLAVRTNQQHKFFYNRILHLILNIRAFELRRRSTALEATTATADAEAMLNRRPVCAT